MPKQNVRCMKNSPIIFKRADPASLGISSAPTSKSH